MLEIKVMVSLMINAWEVREEQICWGASVISEVLSNFCTS